MRFSEEAERFLQPGSERLVVLAGLLAARGLRYSVVRTGTARHLLAPLGEGRPSLIIAAHYDRFPGSPGALDNSCACLQLVEFAGRVRARGPAAPSILLAFTDAEEVPATGGAKGQGAFSLARALRSASEPSALAAAGAGARRAAPFEVPPALVLDVTGRGDRLLVSSTPARLLARHGLAASRSAAGYRSLVALAGRAAARAGLPAPERLPLPWSDDLGLVLGGLAALVVSLLPEPELASVRSGSRPATWDLLHGPEDGPELASEASFDLMARFLDAVAAETAR